MKSPIIVAALLVIPILIACSCVEHSTWYASAAATLSVAEETKTAGNDDNIKSDVKEKDCKDNNDDGKADACSESKSKDTVTSKSSDDTTTKTSHNNDDNKKQKDPFLLPFP